MLSALLCALAAASGYGPSATPRATAPSPGVLVDGFQPRITNVVHGTPRMTASWQCSTRLFPETLDSQGSDPSIGVCYTPGHFLTRIEAASGRCDPPVTASSGLTNLTEQTPPRCFAGVRVSSANGLSTVPHTVPPLTECVLLLGGCWDPYPGGLTAPNRQIWHPFSNFLQLQVPATLDADNNIWPPSASSDPYGS